MFIFKNISKANIHKRIQLICAIILFAIINSGCRNKSEPYLEGSDFLMDTYVTVKIYDKCDEKILSNCFNIIKEYEQKFSSHVSGSEIDKINNANGSAVQVSAETADLLRKAVYYGDISSGAFDATIGSVFSLWNFNTEQPKLPDEILLAKALESVDYKNIIIQDNLVQVNKPGAALELGGIAKGYIADLVIEYLRENGVKNAILNFGGDLGIIGGKPPESRFFSIGVQQPFTEELAAVLHVGNKSVATSGNYQRYFTLNDKLYFHILNPKTGYPAESGLSGVTVITDSAIDADALATITFIFGLELGMEFIEGIENTEAVFITSDDEIYYTSGADTYTEE